MGNGGNQRSSIADGDTRKNPVGGGAVDLWLPKPVKRASAEELKIWRSAWLVHQIDDLLFDPGSSWAAFVLYWWLIPLTCVSITFVCLHTVPPDERPISDQTFDTVEIICTVVYTAELMLETLAALISRRASRLYDVFYIVDLVAALPLYIELIAHAFDTQPVLEPLRLMRVLKLARRYDGARVLVAALHLSKEALCVPLYFCICGVFLFAGLLWAVEGGEKEEHFISIPAAMWLYLVTLTTVGYGDISPTTAGGKIITSFAMLLGVLFMAMPIAIGKSHRHKPSKAGLPSTMSDLRTDTTEIHACSRACSREQFRNGLGGERIYLCRAESSRNVCEARPIFRRCGQGTWLWCVSGQGGRSKTRPKVLSWQTKSSAVTCQDRAIRLNVCGGGGLGMEGWGSQRRAPKRVHIVSVACIFLRMSIEGCGAMRTAIPSCLLFSAICLLSPASHLLPSAFTYFGCRCLRSLTSGAPRA